MAICEVNSEGYCERHKIIHAGRLLYWATLDTPEGERYREAMDRRLLMPQQERKPLPAASKSGCCGKP